MTEDVGETALRRLAVFVLGTSAGAALSIGCALSGLLAFSSVGGMFLAAVSQLALIASSLGAGAVLAWLAGADAACLLAGGSVGAGAFSATLVVSGIASSENEGLARPLGLLPAGVVLGLAYAVVLGAPAAVGAELRRRRAGDEGE